MTQLHPEMVERFKDRVGFDATMRAEAPGRSVLVEWPDMLTAPGIAAQGWSLAADTTLKETGGAERKWVLRRAKETLSIDAFVSSSGVEGARQFFLARASNTMMVDVPYERGPEGIGTLCVSLVRPTSSSLLWVFHNVFTLVRTTYSQADVVIIAKWLQAQYQAGLMPSDTAALRALPSLEVSADTLSVGEAVEVTLLGNGVSDARYLIRTEADEQALLESRFPGPRVELQALVPGRTSADVHVIDRTTLLSSTTRIELEVLNSEA